MKELYVVETYFSWLLSACASLKCTCGSIWNRTTKSVSCWWLRLSLGHSTSFSPLRNAGECCQLVSYILKFSAKRCVQVTFSFHFYKFCCVSVNRTLCFWRQSEVNRLNPRTEKGWKLTWWKKIAIISGFSLIFSNLLMLPMIHFINEGFFFFFFFLFQKVHSNFEQISEKISESEELFSLFCHKNFSFAAAEEQWFQLSVWNHNVASIFAFPSLVPFNLGPLYLLLGIREST